MFRFWPYRHAGAAEIPPGQRWAFAALRRLLSPRSLRVVRRSAALKSACSCKFSRTSRETLPSALRESLRPGSMLTAIIIDAPPTSTWSVNGLGAP